MQRQFNLQSSAFLAITLIAIHVATGTALLMLTLPLWAHGLLIFLLLASMLNHLWRNAWLSAPSSTVAVLLDGDRIVLTQHNGSQIVGKLLPNCLISPLLTVLNILPQKNSFFAHSIIIFPDSLDTESFRQLRVSLRWQH